jgi:hypothetical protein
MSKYLTKTLHQRAYAEAYARHQESLRLGLLEHYRNSTLFPSTVGGDRGPCSPLGGVAVPGSEKGSEEGNRQ